MKDEEYCVRQQEKDIPALKKTKERLQARSPPQKPVMVEECIIDNEIIEMEISIQEVEKKLDVMAGIKRLQEKKDKLDKLKQKL